MQSLVMPIMIAVSSFYDSRCDYTVIMSQLDYGNETWFCEM